MTTTTVNRHVVGLYPADVPRSLWKPHLPDYQTWTRHMEYWKDTLVGHMHFPAGKVSKRNAIRRALHDPLLQHCTAHFDRTLLDDHPHIFNFTNGRISGQYPNIKLLNSSIMFERYIRIACI